MKQQVKLQFDSNKTLIAWIDANFYPRSGMRFTGKDGRTGVILEVYSSIIALADINRTWRVGGL